MENVAEQAGTYTESSQTAANDVPRLASSATLIDYAKLVALLLLAGCVAYHAALHSKNGKCKIIIHVRTCI